MLNVSQGSKRSDTIRFTVKQVWHHAKCRLALCRPDFNFSVRYPHYLAVVATGGTQQLAFPTQ